MKALRTKTRLVLAIIASISGLLMLPLIFSSGGIDEEATTATFPGTPQGKLERRGTNDELSPDRQKKIDGGVVRKGGDEDQGGVDEPLQDPLIEGEAKGGQDDFTFAPIDMKLLEVESEKRVLSAGLGGGKEETIPIPYGDGNHNHFGTLGRTLQAVSTEASVYKNSLVLGKRRATSLSNLPKPSSSYDGKSRPFKFHVYDIPRKYIEGAMDQLKEKWSTSFCNRHKVKTNYTLLDWRHAHSLFTVDVFITRWLRFHPQHTNDPNEADVFIIPMMTHLYNCAGLMHYTNEILAWVSQFPYSKALNAHDHYYFWWRWGMHHGSVKAFWKKVQRTIPNANIISFDYLEIMGRNWWQDFSLALKPRYDQAQNWIVMPYPDFSPYLIEPIQEPHAQRDIFFYFAGTSSIGGIRRWIKRNCEANPKDCVFAEFAKSVIDDKRVGVPTEYPLAMKKSLFCGHAAGDALSSRRPTSAVLAGCIPVLVCDLCLYAWENFIDYDQFSIVIHEDDVIQGKLFEILRSIPEETIKRLQANLLKVRSHFVYNTEGPPNKGDALDTLVGQLAARGKIVRQYKRWFLMNDHLSADMRDYPAEPKNVRRYVKDKADEKDFNGALGKLFGK